jgi:hypothetical protein
LEQANAKKLKVSIISPPKEALKPILTNPFIVSTRATKKRKNEKLSEIKDKDDKKVGGKTL